MKHFNKIKEWFFNQRYLYFLFVLILMVPNVFLFYTESMSIVTRVAFILLPLSVYMILMVASRKPGVMIWVLLPMLVFGAFQLVLLNLFGESIIASDMFLNVFTTNSGEALELLNKLIPAIVGVCLLYIPTLVLGICSIRLPEELTGRFRRRIVSYAACLFVVGLAFAGLSRWHNSEFRVHLHIFPANIFYNMKMAVDSFRRSNAYEETSREFKFHSKSSHNPEQREIYILVIGETGRAHNWGIYGYERNTTPLLQQTSGLIHFTDMVTQSNATHKSVPMLLSLACAENFEQIYHQKSIVSAFREAGFRTAFFSNHLPNHSFIDYFADEADRRIYLKKDTVETYNPHDKELVKLVYNEIERGDRKLFIVLHSYGSHFNYQERYPRENAYFMPDTVQNISKKIRDKLLNAYDNSIRYTDRFLYDLIQCLQKENAITALIYSADHGEDILDDKRQHFLHASPVPTYYQLHVPSFLWISSVYNSVYPDIYTQVQANSKHPVTTNIIFHTMLSVGGVETPFRNDSLSVASEKFIVTPRCYLNDHNLPRRLNRIRLKKEDIEMFRKSHMVYP